VGNTRIKKPLWRCRRKCNGNNKMDFQVEGYGVNGLDRGGSGYGNLEGTFEYGNKPSCSIKWGGGIS